MSNFLNTTYTGEVDYSVFLKRNGIRLKNDQGVSNIADFVLGFTITEGLGRVCMECNIMIEDAAGLLGAITGSEQIEIRLRSAMGDRMYVFRAMGISNRVKSSRGSDVYALKCVSEEYIKNEAINVFGHSNVIFSNTEGSEIVKTLLKGKNFLNSDKQFYSEETLNTHPFIAPNLRPLDVLFMVAQRSIRKPKAGGMLQNGFVFYENSLGFHFKSLDKLVADITDQMARAETSTVKGLPRMYRYDLSEPQVEETRDNFIMTGTGFENDTCYMKPLREGSYCGYSIGFDPVSLPSSQIGISEDSPAATYRYSLSDMWNKMEHLDDKNSVNPYTQFDKDVKSYIDSARRIRYSPIPNRIFDSKDGQAQATYTELTQLEAYEFARRQSLKNVQVNAEVPINMDLYAGTGIDINVPAIYNDGDYRENDKRYSGRYLIHSLTHNVTSTSATTELHLMKDSTLRQRDQIA
jgi:hypothetical protein